MKTKLIGIKEFRKDITSLWKKARNDNTRYIVMYHSTPIFTVNSVNRKEAILEELMADVKEAREDAENGKIYTPEEVYKELGLK